MNSKLIAPCGMNCNLCLAHLREKSKYLCSCSGCRSNKDKPKSCDQCIIRNCEILKKNNWKYCSNKCKKYPCLRLKNIDKRYRTKYGMSMIENLENIKEKGIRKFIKNEEKRWIKGNRIFCVHNKKYFAILPNKKN
jgi:hypothetical protein